MGLRYLDETPNAGDGKSRIRYLDDPVKDESPEKSPTFTDKVAKSSGDIVKELWETIAGASPVPLPETQQDFVDLGAGLTEAGGLLKDVNPLSKNATESGFRTAGRVLDPVAMAVGAKGFQLANMAPKLLGNVGKVLTKTPIRQSMLGGAGAGASVGALSGDPMKMLEGAGVGVLLSPIVPTISKLHEIIADINSGANGEVVRYLNKLFPDKPEVISALSQLKKANVNEVSTTTSKKDVIGALSQLKGIVPGEVPTTGMGAVSGSTKIPGLKALEQQARQRSTTLFTKSDLANTRARVDPFDDIANPGERWFNPNTQRVEPSELESLRAKVTAPMYHRVNSVEVQIPPKLMSALEGAQATPIVNRAEKAIDQTAANVGGVSTRGSAYVPKGADRLGMLPDTPFMPQHETMTIGELQKVKDQLGKRISDLSRATDAASTTERNNLITVRKELINQMTGQSGDYAVANELYRKMSAPQNQADVASVLRDKLLSQTGQERYLSFLNALENSPSTIRSAGGDPRFKDWREIMTPEQTRQINDVSKSVRREADYENLNAPREMLPKMESSLSSASKHTPSLLKIGISIIKNIFSNSGTKVTEDAVQILDRAAADPKFMQELLNQALPKDRNTLIAAIRDNAKRMRGAGTGVTVNATEDSE